MQLGNFRNAVVLLACSISWTLAPAQDPAPRWTTYESTNFRIYTRGIGHDPVHIAKLSEAWRDELIQRWLDTECHPWAVPCHLVIHPSRASYRRVTDHGSANTVGCSTVRCDHEKVLLRRIDVRGDLAGSLDKSLPHELTHVVLADSFCDVAMPAWADEGSAVLADPECLQETHRRSLQAAIYEGRSIPLERMLSSDELAIGAERAVFYGQSASLVSFLLERGAPQLFLKFVRSAASEGASKALAHHYHIADVGELNRLWRQQVIANAGSIVRHGHTIPAFD
jgi:hypothetical protein